MYMTGLETTLLKLGFFIYPGGSKKEKKTAFEGVNEIRNIFILIYLSLF